MPNGGKIARVDPGSRPIGGSESLVRRGHELRKEARERRRRALIRRRNINAVVREGELEIIYRGRADGLAQAGHGDAAGLAPRFGKQGRAGISAPPGTSRGGRAKGVVVLDVSQHQLQAGSEIDFSFDPLFAEVVGLIEGLGEVVAAAIVGRPPWKCGQKIRIQNTHSSSTHAGSGDDVYETRPSGGSIIGAGGKGTAHTISRVRESGLRQAADCIRRIKGRVVGLIGKVSGPLQGRGHAPGVYSSGNLAIPFLGPEEKDFVLLDRPTNGVSKVVAAKLGRMGPRIVGLKIGVVGVQDVITSEVIGAAVKLVGAALRDQGDLAPGISAVLGSIAVPLDLELLNGINGRINK